MTIKCSLDIKGTSPEQSVAAFIQSYQSSAKISNYAKYEDQLNEYFRNRVQKSIDDNNIRIDGLGDSFKLDIRNNRIEFSSSMFEVANMYEYGSDNIYPHRFIEPAVIDVANQMSDKIIDEAISIYQKNTRTISIKKNF